MDFRQAHAYVSGLIRRGIKYELSKIRRLLELVGNPHEGLRWIHCTGTNGKGSTVAMLEGLLRGRGLRVGLFTSPHLVSMLERFRVDGDDISEEAFARHVTTLQPAIEAMASEETGPPTFFEICTALACLYFVHEGVDVAVAEVGLGGRLDATNVVRPMVGIITNVAMDHPKTLGPTLEHICREKCGIIKSGVPLVTGVREPGLLAIVEDTCREREAPLHVLDREARVERVTTSLDEGTSFDWCVGDEAPQRLTTPLVGFHQARNAALALLAARLLPGEFRPSRDGLNRGLALTRWAGRFEVIGRSPLVICDGGHNVDGLTALRVTWDHVMKGTKAWVVAGFSGDKSIGECVDLLAPVTRGMVLSRSDNYRAADPAHLVDEVRRRMPGVTVEVEADPGRALVRARDLAGAEGTVLVTGSLYLLGNVLASLPSRGGGEGVGQASARR